VVPVFFSYHPLPLLPGGGESPSLSGEGLGERLFLFSATTPYRRLLHEDAIASPEEGSPPLFLERG